MDRLKIDNDWFGVLVGIITPVTFYGLSMIFESIFHYMVTTPFLLIICIASNFIPVLFYTRYEINKTSRGIVLVTVFMGLLFFYYKLFIIGE